MKKFVICLLLLNMILSLTGCEKRGEDLPVAESEKEVMQPQVEQGDIAEGGDDADISNESVKVEPNKNPPKDSAKNETEAEQEAEPEAENTVEYPEGIQLEQADGESFFRFDHSAVIELPKDNPGYRHADKLEEKSEATYSGLMERIGEDGLIVAGYATDVRESHQPSNYFPFTVTNFMVTDVFFGTANTSLIKIKEPYALREMDGKLEITYSTKNLDWLENGEQVLLFLSKYKDGSYVKQFTPIPLSEDYRDYNEENKTSMFNFFRGVKSEYLNQEPTNEPQKLPSRVTENGSIEYYFDPSAYEPTFVWPQRNISDEELLEELSENVILRTATEYEIVIWPYGHKNAGSGYQDGDFAKASMP